MLHIEFIVFLLLNQYVERTISLFRHQLFLYASKNITLFLINNKTTTTPHIYDYYVMNKLLLLYFYKNNITFRLHQNKTIIVVNILKSHNRQRGNVN